MKRLYLLYIDVRYVDRLMGIQLIKWGKLTKLWIAGILLKTAWRICPELHRHYDMAVWNSPTGRVDL